MRKVDELKNALIVKRAELWVFYSQIRIKEREELQLVAAIRAIEGEAVITLSPKKEATKTPLDLASLDEAALEQFRVGRQEEATKADETEKKEEEISDEN